MVQIENKIGTTHASYISRLRNGTNENVLRVGENVTMGVVEADAEKKKEKKGGKKKDEKPLEIDMTIEDPPIFEAPIVNPRTKDFDPRINGVVVTKIHGPPHLRIVKQMLCLFTKAYNNRVNHDIIMFTSEKIDQKDITELETIVHPAKLVVEIDNPGLDKMIDDLTPGQQKELVDRCNVNSTSELTWYTECTEKGSFDTLKGERIAYGWQAEFRSKWIWTHPLLAPYKYMMWMDSDAFCTRTWKQDPFATIERHDLALLFDHFPQGSANGYEFPRKTVEAFDKIICDVNLVNGTLVVREGRCKNRPRSRIKQVHGFFHVSSLDFYRSDPVAKWNDILIGDSKFSRRFDDQIEITIPAAVLASDRSRDMKSLGVKLRVFHNYVLDGLPQDWRGYFDKWWDKNANTTFPEASGQCEVHISG
jgi:hypothetical protein